ncbi:hypothetical protein MKEN_00306500 [Mycena kentingensis (nom. inval.)]|nr:hypothetical protein MKEN_00306500 [Mycena kentingensis (nom. inval.)]
MKSNWYFLARASSPERSDEGRNEGPCTRRSYRDSVSTKKIISCVAIIGFSVALVVAVVITGVLFNRSVVRTETKHSFSPDSNLVLPLNAPDIALNAPAIAVMLNFKNFDPASSILSFDIQAALGQLDGDRPPASAVCVFIADAEGLSSLTTLKINYGDTQYYNTDSYNITTEGSISHFPFDIYNGSALFGARSVTNLTDNSALPCETALNQDPTGSEFISITEFPLLFLIGQDLDALSAKISPQLFSPSPDESPYVKMVLVSATVHRRQVIKLFAVLMFITVWLVTLSVVFATFVVLLRGRRGDIFNVVAAGTALLFALPSLRSATPGIPVTPTTSDAVVSASIFALLCYWIGINLAGKEDRQHEQDLIHDKSA